jgi:hypothetical protein
MRSKRVQAAVVLLAGVFALAASDIDLTHRYGWGENVGWTNWRDANGGADGVHVGSTFLAGFIWCENVGWINVGDGTPADGTNYANASGSDFGVNIDTNGDLFGLAWGENIGWVNFDTRSKGGQRARLDRSAGRFRGYAWAENVGWLNLDDAEKFVALAWAPAPSADIDNDGDVDLTDFARFETCFNGPNRPARQTDCAGVDFDHDSDIDLGDFGRFQTCFNGPNRPKNCS